VSAENVEIVRRMCEAYARGGWDVAAEVLAPEIEWDASTYLPWPDASTERSVGKGSGVEVRRRFAQAWTVKEAGRWPGPPTDREAAIAAVTAD
jgi:ketosteroid isomerase-like protein